MMVVWIDWGQIEMDDVGWIRPHNLSPKFCLKHNVIIKVESILC